MPKGSGSRAIGRTATGKFIGVSGAPGGSVIRGTRMPDGSTFVTIAPEARKAASARATSKIMEIRSKRQKKG